VVEEALHYGLPVLVSKNVGCHTELVDEGTTGFIFDPYDKYSLKEALLRMSEPSFFHQIKNNVEGIDFSIRENDQITAYILAAHHPEE